MNAGFMLAALLQIAPSVETLQTRDACAQQLHLERITNRCAELLSAPPNNTNTRKTWGPAALIVDAQPEPVDMLALDAAFGEARRASAWSVWPKAVATPAGACRLLAFGHHGGFATHIRYDRAPDDMPRVLIEPKPKCPNAASAALFDRVCTRILQRWPKETEPTEGVAIESALYGEAAVARVAGPVITREQVEVAFGPATVVRPGQTVHRASPWFDSSGRRCAARAHFMDGRLTRLDVWRAGRPSPPLTRTAPAEPTLDRIDALCDALHARDVRRAATQAAALGGAPQSTDTNVWLQGLHRLRLHHLVNRYGAPVFVTAADDACPVPHGLQERLIFYLRDAEGVPRCALRTRRIDGEVRTSALMLSTW